MLKVKGEWRFHSPGEMPDRARWAFSELVGKVASQGENRQSILERFKSHFASATGSSSSWSSSESWAESDLDMYMQSASANAPLFIAAFYDACQSLVAGNPEFVVPDAGMINELLDNHDVKFAVRPPNVVSLSLNDEPIHVPVKPPSLDEEAQQTFQAALQNAERFLSGGHYRQAVQEVLWLLETVSTAFQGLDTATGTIEGKYFNQIMKDLRAKSGGTTLQRVIEWVTTLHGYLSSPTGGGVRHGTDLKKNIPMRASEARLFCNLIRSYLYFLLEEHESLSQPNVQKVAP